MKSDQKELVLDFLKRNSPEQAINSMEVLAKLKYPLSDKYAFECALEAVNDEATKVLLLTSFSANDFPMLSAESGLEKFIVKFQPFPFPIPLAPLPPIELPDFRATPSACEIYRADFSPEAADCGCRAYAEALRQGFNHLQATLIGLFAARRYTTTGVCF